MSKGIYVSEHEFRSFAQQTEPLAGPLGGQIATRLAAGDMTSFFGLLPNPDPVLRQMGQNIRVYRNLLADPAVMGPRRRRIGALMKMERGFDLDQSKRTPVRVLKALEDVFSQLGTDRFIRDWIDGAFFGYRVSEVMWGNVSGLVAPVDVIAKPSEYGDRVFFIRDGGEAVHSAVYLADDIVFTKNGTGFEQPWTLMHLKDLLDIYGSTEHVKLIAYRERDR